MDRTKQPNNIRVEPPNWLVKENARARKTVKRQISQGNTARTIWNDTLERTNRALKQYGYPVPEPEPEVLREVRNG